MSGPAPVRALAVRPKKRVPWCPTSHHCGIGVPGSMSRAGSLLPAGEDATGIIAKLNADTNAACGASSVKPRFDDLGATPRGTTPGTSRRLPQIGNREMGPVIRDARIKVEN